MRRCFSYCAVFPKDFIFEREDLIKLWMAQGYLQDKENMEIMGRECFQNLAARSFFQDFEKAKDDGSIISCKMHDIVHDFAQYLTRNECFNVEINGHEDHHSKMESFSREARHSLIVLQNRTIPFPETIHSFKKLHTLFVDGYASSNVAKLEGRFPVDFLATFGDRYPSVNVALPKIIDHLSCLRTLTLSYCGIEEVLSNIGKLIHMRYLNLSGNDIKELPEAICELYNMLTLDVSFCDPLEKLPDNIGKLVKLRHLSVHTYSIDRFLMMRGMGGFCCLRELDEFHVSCSSGDGSGAASNLGDLKNLNHLHYLGIRWLGDVKDPYEAKKAELKSKKCLTYLRLCFESRIERSMIRDEEVLEALEPYPDLESLEIVKYDGITMWPRWIVMSLTKLRKVTLWSCWKIEHLPPLGKLPSLEELSVSELYCVKKVGHEFLGLQIDDDNSGKGDMAFPSKIIAFPKLKSLTIWGLINWEEWDDDNGSWRRLGNEEDQTNISSSIMPCLRSLTIIECPKLKALPDYLYHSTTLGELDIRGSPVLSIGLGKDWPNTSHTRNITIQ